MELWVAGCMIALFGVGGYLIGTYYSEYIKVNSHLVFFNICFRTIAKMAREDYDNENSKNKNWLAPLFKEAYGEAEASTVNFTYNELINAYKTCYQAGFQQALQSEPRLVENFKIGGSTNFVADRFVYDLYTEVFYEGYDAAKQESDLEEDDKVDSRQE